VLWSELDFGPRTKNNEADFVGCLNATTVPVDQGDAL